MHNDNLLSNTHPVAPLGLVTMKSFADRVRKQMITCLTGDPIDRSISISMQAIPHSRTIILTSSKLRTPVSDPAKQSPSSISLFVVLICIS